MNTAMTISGSAGGVARSLLAILNKAIQDKHDPLHSFLNNCMLHLIDRNQKTTSYYSELCPNLRDRIEIHEFDLGDNSTFNEHLDKVRPKIVIDLSWADTLEMLSCCNRHGIYYINSALENTMIDENEELYKGFPLAERLIHFEAEKGRLNNTTAIIGSGMNPGVVQWMALELMKINGAETPLGCYIVEEDTSFYSLSSDVKEEVVYTSWSPECFLDEAIMSYPMFMKHGTPLYLYNQPYELEFNVSLGQKQFNGCLMPHEEVYTLGKQFNMETGFIYKINEHTTKIIRRNLSDVDKIWELEMEVLDPSKAPLDGEDFVGVLLVYDKKEIYMYNVQDNKTIYEIFQTNATYFQVACGIYAGTCSLLIDNLKRGIYYVDELILQTSSRYGKYLKHYMNDFIIGENPKSEGLLLERKKNQA